MRIEISADEITDSYAEAVDVGGQGYGLRLNLRHAVGAERDSLTFLYATRDEALRLQTLLTDSLKQLIDPEAINPPVAHKIGVSGDLTVTHADGSVEMDYPLGLDEYPEDRLATELAERRAQRRAGMCDYCGRPHNAEPSCKERDRHRGEVPGPPLSLEQFHAMNVRRCNDLDGFGHAFATSDSRAVAIETVKRALRGEVPKPAALEVALAELEAWSPADWITAVVGELGELANLVKKRRREEIPDGQVRDEWADTFTYLDLLAESVGVHRAMPVVLDKFDQVSRRRGWQQ